MPHPVVTLAFVANQEKGFKVDLTVDLIARINALSNGRGMKNKAVASRVLEWFLVQPSEIQAVILGQIPTDAEFLELILRRVGERDPQVVDSGKSVAAKPAPPKGGRR